MDLNDYIVTEKEFLHDMSNQLVIALACASFLKSSFGPRPDQLSEKELDKLIKLSLSIDKIQSNLKQRKEFVSQQN